MLLTDTFIIENLQVLSESKSAGTMKISGVFQRANEANNNGRIYSKPLLQRELSNLTEAIKNRRLMGELDHPTNETVRLSNVSHLVTNLYMKGDEVLGESELLNTPAGLTAQALIKAGVNVGISSRGMGTLTEIEDGSKHVNEDFKLVTFDLVADPSTRGAFPALSESTQSTVDDIIKKVYPKAQKERLFITLLKEAINVSEEEEPDHDKLKQADDKQLAKAKEKTNKLLRKHGRGSEADAREKEGAKAPTENSSTLYLVAGKLLKETQLDTERQKRREAGEDPHPNDRRGGQLTTEPLKKKPKTTRGGVPVGKKIPGSAQRAAEVPGPNQT